MGVFIVQKDGGKTPIDMSLLVKLANSGRILPETRVEIDGQTRPAFELEELAPIFEAQGFSAEASVSVPPRVGEPAKKEPEPEPEPEPESDLPLTELEIARLAARRVAAKFKETTFAQIVTTFVVLCVFVEFARLIDGGFSVMSVSALFSSALKLGIALAAYYGVRASLRASALLREESAIRQELYLQKLTRDKRD